MHVDAAYGGAALLAPSVRAPVRGHRARRLARDRPAQVAVRAVRLRGAALPRPALARAVHTPGRVVPRRDPRRADGLEPERLRVPPDPPRPRAAALVLARGPRLRRVPRRDRAGARRRRAPRPSGSAALPHLELVREPELSIVLFRRIGWSAADYDALVGAAARRADRVRRAVDAGTARPSPASRSCIPTRRSRSSTRSSRRRRSDVPRAAASARAPQAARARARAASSSREHRARVRAVGRDHQQPREAAREQLVVVAVRRRRARTRAGGRTCRAAPTSNSSVTAPARRARASCTRSPRARSTAPACADRRSPACRRRGCGPSRCDRRRGARSTVSPSTSWITVAGMRP